MSLIEALDLLVAVAAVYLALRWLTASLSRRALLALGVVVALYAVSRGAGLFLTERLLRVAGSVIALALLVAFQEEVRRGFERLFLAVHPGRSRSEPAASAIDVLVDGVARLSSQRVGALIVVRGRTGLDAHLRGGVDLRGALSVPLLCSIFNTDSPGHDGAVVLDGTRVERFGAHLPLSRHVAQLPEHGTRHAAALGLAERADALVVVVSEETGTVSVAEDGVLEALPHLDALRVRLWRHGERAGLLPTRRARRPRYVPEHLAEQTLAAGLVAAWWLLTPSPAIVQRTYLVPVQYVNPAPDAVLEEAGVSQVAVTLAGPDRAFDLVDPEALRLSVDVAQLPDGTHYASLTPAQLEGHGPLEVLSVTPDTVLVRQVPLHAVELPVRVQLTGAPPEGLALVAAVPEPRRVRLMMPAAGGYPRELETEPVDVSRLFDGRKVSVRLRLPPGARTTGGAPDVVDVRGRFRPA